MYEPDFVKSYHDLIKDLPGNAPLEKSRKIRDWVSENVPAYTTAGTYFDNEAFIHNAPILDVVTELYEKRLGLRCGGASLIMARICQENGIYTIYGNFGNIDLGLTHMACLLKPIHEKDLWYIMDPHWGTELLTKNNEAIDYHQAAALFNRGQYKGFFASTFQSIRPVVKINNISKARTIEADHDWHWADKQWVNYWKKLLNTENKAVTYFFPFEAYHYCPKTQ